MRRVGAIDLLAIVFVVAAWPELLLYDHDGTASMAWLPVGIGLGAVMLYGAWIWPGIAIGAFVIVAAYLHHPVAGLLVAPVAVLESLMASVLLRRIHLALDRVRDVLVLAGVVLVATLVGATLAVGVLELGGLVSHGGFVDLWARLWWGPLTASLLVTPAVLTWGTRTLDDEGERPPHRFETIALLLSLVDVCGFSLFVVAAVVVSRTARVVLRDAAAVVGRPAIRTARGVRGDARPGHADDRRRVTQAQSASQSSSASRRSSRSPRSRHSRSAPSGSRDFARSSARARSSKARSTRSSRSRMPASSASSIRRPSVCSAFVKRMFSAEILAGLIISESLHDAYRRALREHLSPEGSLVGRRVHIRARRANGSEFPAEISIARVVVDGNYLFTGFVRDVTGEHETERARREAQEQLEQRVNERTAELQRGQRRDQTQRGDARRCPGARAPRELRLRFRARPLRVVRRAVPDLRPRARCVRADLPDTPDEHASGGSRVRSRDGPACTARASAVHARVSDRAPRRIDPNSTDASQGDRRRSHHRLLPGHLRAQAGGGSARSVGRDRRVIRGRDHRDVGRRYDRELEPRRGEDLRLPGVRDHRARIHDARARTLRQPRRRHPRVCTRRSPTLPLRATAPAA